MHRVVKRAIVIHFNDPKIGPVSDDEEDAYTELDELISSGEVTRGIGWAVNMGKVLLQENNEVKKGYYKKLMHGVVTCRKYANWSLYCFLVSR